MGMSAKMICIGAFCRRDRNSTSRERRSSLATIRIEFVSSAKSSAL
jgi:hypothetical protein